MGKEFNPLRIQRLNDAKRLSIFNIEKIIVENGLKDIKVMGELGVGTGAIADIFLKTLPEASCIGLDISEDMLKWIVENRSNYEGRFLLKHQEKGNQIPLEDASLDLLSFVTVYHEVEDSIELLKEIRRVVRPEGKFLFIDWSKEAQGREWGPPSEELYSAEEIEAALKISGFKEIKKIDINFNIVCYICS